MKSKKLTKNIVLFTFPTRKELTLHFFRIQEFYESPKKSLFKKKFSVFDFLNESMNAKGEIDYFSYWTGFNIPGDFVNKWWVMNGRDSTPAEQALFNRLHQSNIDFSKPYYIIGALHKDEDVIKHEIAHALYYTNTKYATEMNDLIYDFFKTDRKNYCKVEKRLNKMGYGKNVIKDEIQAYLSSEKSSYLKKEFDITPKNVPIIKQFRDVLLKYNTFQSGN